MPDTTTTTTTPSVPNSQIWICLNLLDDVQAQIRFADSKAGFISMLNVFLFGFLASNFEKMRALYESGKVPGTLAIVLTLSLVGLYLLLTVASFFLVVSSVMSRFVRRGAQSKVFFGDIARSFAPGQYASVISQLSDAEWVGELGNQVAEVSALALVKHRQIRWATMTTLAAVLVWLLAMVALVCVRWFNG